MLLVYVVPVHPTLQKRNIPRTLRKQPQWRGPVNRIQIRWRLVNKFMHNFVRNTPVHCGNDNAFT